MKSTLTTSPGHTGTGRLSKIEYGLSLAYLVAKRSTCPRRSVGCVIINEYNFIRATGYNGVPRGFPHCVDTPCPGAQYVGDPSKLGECQAAHAEYNAFLQLSDIKEGKTAFLTVSPCRECAKLFANSFVDEIYTIEQYNDDVALGILKQAGIKLEIVEVTEYNG